jgi:hypothetical protein
MFSGRDGIVVPVDEQGFVHRCSGTQFGLILDFLRTGKVRMPLGEAAHAELVDEADFYLLRSHMERAPSWHRFGIDVGTAPKSVVVTSRLENHQRAVVVTSHAPPQQYDLGRQPL